MKRKIYADLEDWMVRPNRKPLILRGARQTGKTYAIREFASDKFSNLVELNFDAAPEKADLFASRDIERILRLIALDSDSEIIPGQTLLFFDEIQNAPSIIPLLRYFYELRPDLHVIAAGSLLDFVLNDHDFAMPVGRIEYMFMGPMSFTEFLLAEGKDALADFLANFSMNDVIPSPIHEKLLDVLKVYCLVGGMPSVVKAYMADENPKLASLEQQVILQTYKDDFIKYRDKINSRLLSVVFSNIPHSVCRKLKYVNIDRNEKARPIAECVDMLQMARVAYRVTHSAGNGIPLGAEANSKVSKLLFLDVGLLASALGVSHQNIQMAESLMLVNNGTIAEQFAGQHLLHLSESYRQPELYYWHREKRNASAEVDYLHPYSGQVVPVEIKAGKTGALKSLQVFAAEKGTDVAVRFNSDIPSSCLVNSKNSRPFQLLSLPLYLIEELDRLLEEYET